MRDSLNAILVLSYFPCSDFPGLLVCDGGDFGEMHTTKIVFFLQILQGWAPNQANVTGLYYNQNNISVLTAQYTKHNSTAHHKLSLHTCGSVIKGGVKPLYS